ncbi:diphosphomevalonate decarboxylase [Chytridiales sp. JEL 0842]|nr:diphosphomevalonate decarboxylase [Chytridiales sp. JEL 0842]
MTLPIDIREVTCSAPVNIAVIKYWGKRDPALLLPTNPSLSVTLSQDDLQSRTTVRVSPNFASDALWLNGKPQDINAKRLRNVLTEIRKARKELEDTDPTLPQLAALPIHIASENNFPTAAGLASSASGFACLTYGLAQVFELPLSASDISRMARMGSGSACRSLFGGFVAWEMGQALNGHDSFAVQVAPESHWPDMSALILVVSDAKKDTGSTEGMQLTVETSELFEGRVNTFAQKHMDAMTKAIADRNYDIFAELTMKDSNQFHAVCLDTFPPIFYMNDISRGIISMVHAYNRAAEELDRKEGKEVRKYHAAYTYDAGPNAVLYVLEKDVAEVLELVNIFFPPPADASAEYYGKATTYKTGSSKSARINALVELMTCRKYPSGSLTRIIKTEVGDGPRVLAKGYKADVSLLNEMGDLKM